MSIRVQQLFEAAAACVLVHGLITPLPWYAFRFCKEEALVLIADEVRCWAIGWVTRLYFWAAITRQRPVARRTHCLHGRRDLCSLLPVPAVPSATPRNL